MRHYTISTAPSGVKKSLKALITRQALPDLGGLQDVSELVTKSGYGSVSDVHVRPAGQILAAGWSAPDRCSEGGVLHVLWPACSLR